MKNLSRKRVQENSWNLDLGHFLFITSPIVIAKPRERRMLSKRRFHLHLQVVMDCILGSGVASFLSELILLFLLMSDNVHLDPGPIFPCPVCAGNVTWQGKLVQCYTCSKWVHLRCSLLSLSKFRTLGSFYSWSCATPAAFLLVSL